MGSQPPLLKRFGQHHLIRPEACRPLVRWLRPAGQEVVEVGPGGGVLTGELLEAGARVLGVELDPEWAFHLAARDEDGLRLVVADALEWPWGRLPLGTLVVGNLPYNIATPLLRRLLPYHRVVPRAGFLVQREVAERLTARPGDTAYGALSVLTAARSEAVVLGRVGAGAFRPPPNVESAFVGLELHPPPLPESRMPRFASLVQSAFGHRRKMLRNSLAAALGPGCTELLETAGIDPRARAETIDLEGFLRLVQTVDEGLDRTGA